MHASAARRKSKRKVFILTRRPLKLAAAWSSSQVVAGLRVPRWRRRSRRAAHSSASVSVILALLFDSVALRAVRLASVSVACSQTGCSFSAKATRFLQLVAKRNHQARAPY
eukprot:scaffold46711_cov36-Phaeocystis_antarctica.AAC.2